jgi:hypothetical protein
MASSVALGPAVLLDGQTYSGQTFRQNEVSALAYNQGTGGAVQTRPGVLMGATRMLVAAGAGMSVNVNGGSAIIPSGVGSVQGAYRASLMQTANLTVATSDPVNPRVDAVVVYINDLGTSSSTTVVEVITGTPTAGANLVNLNGAPSPLPTSSLILAYVLVPSSSTSVTGGNISDQRQFTITPGGILPIASVSAAPAGNPGQYGYDTANDRLCEIGASAVTQAKVLPFAPQFATGSSTSQFGLASGGAQVTLGSVNVTTDGNTDLEIHACWRNFNPGAPGPGSAPPVYADFSLFIGSTQLKVCRVANYSNVAVGGGGGSPEGGGAMFHFTQGGSDRPGSGAHTISLQYFDNGSPYTAPRGNSNIQGWELYVRAAPL